VMYCFSISFVSCSSFHHVVYCKCF